MNQSKSEKCALKAAEEEEIKPEFKMPTEVLESPQVNGTDHKDESGSNSPGSPKSKIRTRSRSRTPHVIPPSDDVADVKSNVPESPKHHHNTRNRSKTPQNKMQLEDASIKTIVEVVPEEKEEINTKLDQSSSPLMEDLVLGEAESISLDKDEEEVVPELLFDENDIDVESEGSPNRCKTRRSEAPYISTPKTPKLMEDKDFIVANEVEIQDSEIPDLDSTSESYSSASIDNISTTAVADNETRNVDFTQDSGLVDDITYKSPDRSLTLRETLRNISPRRTIRPVNVDNYRKFALRNNHVKTKDTQSPIPNYDLIERVSGVKRKSSSVQFNEPKKLKQSPGFLNYLRFPFYSLKNTFSSADMPNTIKYDKNEADDEVTKIQLEADENIGRKWCSIM